MRVTSGAREGARQAAVEDDEASVRRAVVASTRLDGDRLDVEAGDRGGPGPPVIVRDVRLEGVAAMRVER